MDTGVLDVVVEPVVEDVEPVVEDVAGAEVVLGLVVDVVATVVGGDVEIVAEPVVEDVAGTVVLEVVRTVEEVVTADEVDELVPTLVGSESPHEGRIKSANEAHTRIRKRNISRRLSQTRRGRRPSTPLHPARS